MSIDDTLKGECFEGIHIAHRFINPNSKEEYQRYYCCDGRECKYKEIIDNKMYCMVRGTEIHKIYKVTEQ